MKKILISLIFIILFLFENNILCKEIIPIQANSNIQAKIKQITSKKLSEDDLFQAVSDIDKGGKNIEKVLPQLILYKVNCIKEGKSVAPGLFIFNQLYGKTSKKVLMKTISPFIKIDNNDLQKVLRLYYDHISVSNNRTRDFSAFKTYLKKKKQSPSINLIEFMFEKSPDDAILTLISVYSPKNKELNLLAKEISSDKIELQKAGPSYRLVRKKEKKGYDTIPNEKWAEKREEIKQGLYRLSQYKNWWVKFYVATVIKKNPYFSEPKILEVLKKEEHPLVKKAVDEILSSNK